MKEVVVILEELLSEAAGGAGKFLLCPIFSQFIYSCQFLKVFPSQTDNVIALPVICTSLSMGCVYSLSDS